MRATFNFANALTLFRIASIPLIAALFFSSIDNARPLAAMVFILAALTDWLDGWVAREYNLSSRFGAFLDPVADKLIVSIALILIVQSDPSLLNAVIASIIIGRELTISALREWMSELGERHKVSVIGYAKENPIHVFVKGFRSESRFTPADGEAEICGTFIESDDNSGFSTHIERFKY